MESLSKLDQYDMKNKQLLGSGGFANVYLVTRKKDNTKFALKWLMMPYTGMNEADKNSIDREIQAMQRL